MGQAQEQKLGESRDLQEQAAAAKDQAAATWHQTAKRADDTKNSLNSARLEVRDVAAAVLITRRDMHKATFDEAQATQARNAGRSRLGVAEAKRDQIIGSIAISDEKTLVQQLKKEQSTLEDTMAEETIKVDSAREAARSAAIKAGEPREVRDKTGKVVQSATAAEASVKKNQLASQALGELTRVHKQDADAANQRSTGALSAVRATVAAVGQALGEVSELHRTAETNAQDGAALVTSTQTASNAANAKLQQATADLTQQTSVRASAQENKVTAEQTQSDAASEVDDSTAEQASSKKDLTAAEDVIAMKKGQVNEFEASILQTRADLTTAAANVADKSALMEKAHAAQKLVLQELNQMGDVLTNDSKEQRVLDLRGSR